jgi:segregation and condensation protein A
MPSTSEAREHDEPSFVVELDRFEGPLDLLLHLIREQDIDIFDIPIARITQQFLDAVAGIERLGLDQAGEFLEMAATLVRIKVQLLLPQRGETPDDLEDPRAELVRRLLEYEHFRDAADRLEDAEADRARRYSRGYIPPRPGPDAGALELEVDWGEVWDALYEVIDRARPPEVHYVHGRIVTLEEKIELILEAVARLTRVQFQELLRQHPDRMHAVATLLAALELARRREVSVRQSRLFGPLWLWLPQAVEPQQPGTHDDPTDH